VSPAALADLRVIDCGRGVAAGLCARFLADRGADVIAVDPPGGHPLARAGAAAERGELHRTLQAGKRSVRFDLAAKAGGESLAELLAEADVLVHDERLEVDADQVATTARATNPKLVSVSITPFGKSGPRCDWKGGDLIGWAAGGLAHGSGDPDGVPLRPGGLQAEHLAALQATAATLIACRLAASGGVGQAVEVSLQEAVAGALEATTGDFSIAREVRRRMGARHPTYHGLGLQRMGDGRWILFGTMPTERMWATTRELIGEPPWAQEERWIDSMERRRDADEIDQLAAEAVADLDTDEIVAEMKAARLPVGLVRDMEAVVASPQLNSRGFFDHGAGAAFLNPTPAPTERNGWTPRSTTP
jgi:crotonobetainyl-CoA:carnitine CoA-transferase CaiB-like acyl-CoA transferase